jgi:hypothetical protein
MCSGADGFFFQARDIFFRRETFFSGDGLFFQETAFFSGDGLFFQETAFFFWQPAIFFAATLKSFKSHPT